MERKASIERNWITSTDKTSFSNSCTKVNELCHEFDENENEIKRDIADLSHGNSTSYPVDYSIVNLVPEMKNLRLSQQQQQQEKELEHLAGYIKAVIPPSGTLVIQHATGSKILDVGTAIFTRKIDDSNNVKNYEQIGIISDIFGSINEPMYALQLERKIACAFLKLDSGVFYLNGHPSNRFVSVECNGNDGYTVIYS